MIKKAHSSGSGHAIPSMVGVSLSEPHTSMIGLHVCVLVVFATTDHDRQQQAAHSQQKLCMVLLIEVLAVRAMHK